MEGDQESLNLLVSTVSMLGNLPVLPTRSDFGPLMPEGFDLDPEDEVELDPATIVRPLDQKAVIDTAVFSESHVNR